LLVRTVLSEQIAWLASLRRRPSRDARLTQLRNALRVLDHERQPALPFRDDVGFQLSEKGSRDNVD
jgi:hypothetical protein